MFSTCSELTPRAPIPDGRMAQFMQPCLLSTFFHREMTLMVSMSVILKKAKKNNILIYVHQHWMLGKIMSRTCVNWIPELDMEKGKHISNIFQIIIMCGEPNYHGLVKDDITGMLIITSSKRWKWTKYFYDIFLKPWKHFCSIIHPLRDNFHG